MHIKTLNIDVLWGCNARCEWCITGFHEDGKKLRYMNFDKFSKIIDHLLEEKIIGEQTVVHPYDRSEPLLNPDISKMMDFLRERNLNCFIATNGSRVPKLENTNLSHMTGLSFSMPGFSQESYDKQHRFNFENIKKNIVKIKNDFIENGMIATPAINYHVYQFNLVEMEKAREFALENDIAFVPSISMPIDVDTGIGYLTNTLATSKLKQASKELLLFYVDDLIKKQPANFKCPHFESVMVINVDGILCRCCSTPPEFGHDNLGEILEMSGDEIRTAIVEKELPVCKPCMDTGLAYWYQNTPKVYGEILQSPVKAD